jgi:hypothetical protein
LKIANRIGELLFSFLANNEDINIYYYLRLSKLQYAINYVHFVKLFPVQPIDYILKKEHVILPIITLPEMTVFLVSKRSCSPIFLFT